jgi:hypothetical protein
MLTVVLITGPAACGGQLYSVKPWRLEDVLGADQLDEALRQTYASRWSTDEPALRGKCPQGLRRSPPRMPAQPS